MPDSALHKPILDWYAGHARDLPWRRRDAGGWAVLISEVMLQQTPVVRVLPSYDAWLTRWPTPAALADEPPGEAVRMWGRLGYPRRALRLHAAATAIDARHAGHVPDDVEKLRALPGVGDYTAAAVSAFAFRHRIAVLDTNVRRVLGRLIDGRQRPALHLVRSERALATDLLPDEAETAATWSVAVMELGALVCTARTPKCVECPVSDRCSWRARGYPPLAGPPPRRQTYAGTDRQCRGRILAVLRDGPATVSATEVAISWPDASQRERALASLLDDGLVVRAGVDSFALP